MAFTASIAHSALRATLRRCRRPSVRFTSTLQPPQKPSTAYVDVSHPEDNPPPEVLIELEHASRFVLPVYARPPVLLISGEGNYVYDSQHRKYLDFTGGIAVNALGHSDKQVAQVMHDQALQLMHTSNAFYHRNAGALAEELVRQTLNQGGLGFAPGTVLEAVSSNQDPRVFFSNSGTEANEGALKIARKVAKDRWVAAGKDASACTQVRVVTFANAFHGRTMGALSATPNPKYQAPFAPLVPGFDIAQLNNKEDVERLVTSDTCAVIIEPIQGEGGVYEAEQSFLKLLRDRCNATGAVLIFDEIQCGLYRTGDLWAHSKLPLDCHPDIVTIAKPLANGYPIGAVLIRGDVAQAMTVGSHGTTFGGSPMATALGLHVLRRLQELSADVLENGAHLQARLSRLADWFPGVVGPVRGRGLILGLPFAGAGTNARIVELARQRGVLVLTAGKDVVRFVPSLTVSRAEVDHAVDVIEGCLARLT